MNTDPTLAIWDEIEELQQRVEAFDGISLKLNWSMLRGRIEGTEYITVRDGSLLVGFIGLYGFGSQMEICGMVRPGYRRRGLFTSLWRQARERMESYPPEDLLLNTPAASASGEAWIRQLGTAAFYSAEYQMLWQEEASAAFAGASASESVSLRPAEPNDRSFQIALDREGFGIPQADAEEMFERIEREPGTEWIIIEWNGTPAGKLRLEMEEDGTTGVYGFVVEASFRGRGIGRSALLQVVERERLNGNRIFLEVAVDNPNALRLYRECGFDVLNQQNYYRFSG
ncbi:GNAT family N-acetyltransferase [Paenibacillus spiritus]|uniref:GNAT family N-acetyltransferase n=1 Tax=Paenibacillus spiritus TaxID=2496557 RepID=A0A5J5GE39_9BACL|nr:GNAT family N-acetyltransferase [Paenibacillus spiritus]KAA9006317.1 GNAT family N-acetyltransferase [Paenibacillus spiritus]